MSDMQISWVRRPTPERREAIEPELGRVKRHLSTGACEGKCFGSRPVAVLVATTAGQISCYCDECYEASQTAAIVFLPVPDAFDENEVVCPDCDGWQTEEGRVGGAVCLSCAGSGKRLATDDPPAGTAMSTKDAKWVR